MNMARTWFVTGSSRGLGRSVVEAALEAGDNVIATARKPAQLGDLVAKYGDRVMPVALDVTDAAAVASAVKAGHRQFGRIDVVVNNAGYGDVAAVEDVTLESFRAQFDTNFFGVVYVTKAVLPILREQGAGHIFQVSSLGGRTPPLGLSAYSSAKWAVGGFSSILAQEVAPLGIKVTVLEPGGIKTDWAGSSMTIPPISKPYEQTVGQFAGFLRSYHGQEPSTPAKIAGVILSLAGREDAPVRLLLGPDAVEYAPKYAQALAESDKKWRDVSLSTAS
jgi:NAD(P)-dependent dehydrogenase (short-subunit alcohol dehydrogenase family)